MPPRRSSRSTKASLEPSAPFPETAVPKRKRGSVADEREIEVEEKENVEKATTNTRRTSSRRTSAGPSTNGRVSSTRSKPTLIHVPETDEESADDASPPVKKSRLSPEVEGPENDSEAEEIQPKTRGSAGAKQRVAKGRKAKTEVVDEVPPPRRPSTRRTVVTSASSNVKRTTRNRSSNAEVNSGKSRPEGVVTSDDESEEEVKPAPRRGSSRISARATKSNARVSNTSSRVEEDASEVEEIDQEDVKPIIKGHKSTSRIPTKKGPTRSSARHISPELVEDSEADNEAAQQPPIPESKSPLENPPLGSPDDDEEIVSEEVIAAAVEDDTGNIPPQEEERSLFDPPPIAIIPPSHLVAPIEDTGPKSRLVIHKMALVNFKSYAGRQEIGPFHKSFSSIVGPNGSGKSNTIDALLFVFGYRASKMRQGKLSELIHNSARYPDLDNCSVEVHFREIVDLPGPDAFEVVPKSQLIVARQAFKNNTSRYTINGRTSNYTEVQTLLKSRGIDLDHKRFLILQGEVESIAQMKPKAITEHDEGLLEYLEDIIGTSRYKEPIEESLLEMERLQEDRSDKMNRLRVTEKKRNALEDKKKEAEDYLRLQNEHVRALSRLWQWYLWKCLLNEEELDKKIVRIQKDLDDETERNKDDITHLEMLEKHYDERQKAYLDVQTAAAEAMKDLAVHEKRAVGLEERRKHANGKTKKLKKSLQDDQNTKAQAIRTIEHSSEKIEREKAKVEEFEESLEKEENILEGIRDSLKDKTQIFHDQIEVKQRELQPWTTKINAKQAEIDVASSERDALAKKAEAVKEAEQEAFEAVEKLQADQGFKIAELDELKSSKANLERDQTVAQKKLRDIQVAVQNLRAKASSSRQKVDEARSSQAANTSQNKVLDSLTRLQNSGRITGFHGRLGSLGTIPDKYDVAISTACGALNNLVVDTVEQGQACIEYLRSQNVGRASFMVLEKIPQVSAMDKIQTPENVPRLFDLITPKEQRFAPAFYKGVHNTLVADNLDQANRIAFGGPKRWRVVTLAGQLIDASGTMSGGGTYVAKGGMSSKLASESVRPEVLRGYEKESEDATRQLEQTLDELRKVEADVDRLAKSGPQIDMSLKKLDLDLQNGKRRISEAEKRVRELKSRSKPDAVDIARIAVLESEIISSSEELERLQERSGKIEKAIQDLEKKILEIGGAKLLTQRSKVEGIRLHINLANDEITKAEVAKAKAEKDSLKLDSTIKSNGTSLQEVEEELRELNEQLEELTVYVTDLRNKVEAAQTAAENSKEDLEALKTELDTKNEEIQAFRQKEMELKQSLTEALKEHKENERLLDHWRTEHDQLTLEEIDDDDDDDDDGEMKPVIADIETPEDVKPGPGEEFARKKNTRHRTPSSELHIYTAEELAKFKKREMIADTELLDEKLKNAKPNLGVLKEYKECEDEYFKRAQDLDTVTNLRDAQKQKYDGLRKQRLDEFMAGFSLISLKLKEMYQMITLGGNAELELVDSMDPFSEGIIFSVMPPKKSWKNISNLSGGEKTLSSLALVFALHVFKPTPLYFMDEIDAALDFRNVSIVANYIKDRTKNAQFIIISLRNDMFELSHRLIGIYKTANATRSISIDNHALTVAPTKLRT